MKDLGSTQAVVAVWRLLAGVRLRLWDCGGVGDLCLETPKGSKVLLWGISSQIIIVIPNIETLHSTI